MLVDTSWSVDLQLLEAFAAHLGGCGILGVGIWLAVTQGNFATLSSSFPSLSAANLLIVTGTFVMIIGFVGCIGAIKENKCLLLSPVFIGEVLQPYDQFSGPPVNPVQQIYVFPMLKTPDLILQ
ncbi:hypothetical protein WISP_35352 [Willisornis vidua]|uniref:Uncharacterized protein n=1 Tax=Willisornis vidua TaxID=1566151 RepID=A0ABQ9DPF8_9PASS|nr:hypothetical protein WISP_35352 [Willisornis vidua]